MKIGFTIGTPQVAGGTKCLLKVAAELRRRGHEVEVFCLAYSLRNYLKHKIFPFKIKWTEEPHRVTFLRSWDHFPDCDALVASAWHTADPVYQWTKKTGGRGIYYVQHHEAIWDGGEKAAETYRLPLKMIVISSWLQEIMKKEYNQESLLCVTPVDEQLFAAKSHRRDRSSRVLMLHHTFDWKGVPEGLEAISRVQKENPKLQLVVVGGREKNPKLPEGVEYHYQPSREQLAQIYADCGIFLCPSWHEGLGMPPMEAMATGSLLVTTDTGGSQDFAHHGVTALVSPPRHVEALSANLKLALSQWEGLEKIREAGQSKIQEFSWFENIDKIEKLILK